MYMSKIMGYPLKLQGAKPNIFQTFIVGEMEENALNRANIPKEQFCFLSEAFFCSIFH